MKLIKFIIIVQVVYFQFLRSDCFMNIFKILITIFFKIAKSVINIVNFDYINTLTDDLATSLFVFPDIFKFVAYFLDSRFFTILIPIEFGWLAIKFTLAILMRIKSFIPTISST